MFYKKTSKSFVQIAAALSVLAGTAAAIADFNTSLRLDDPAKAAPVAGCPTCSPDLALDPAATFLITDERLTPNSTILWPGFLTGLRGFEQFYAPVGNPLYFESPFIDSSLTLLYIHHEFADRSQLAGGQLDVFAVQARVALTERLAFIATKDGHSWLSAGALPEADGWNDLAFGFKYALYVDREDDLVVTPGFRYQMGNGDASVLQSGAQELSPFVSIAKGFDQLHLLANVTGRIPLDNDRGNSVIQWDLHADYEIFPGIAPMVELHGLHYIDDGTALPLSVGGLDYGNLGSSDVSGSTVIWIGAGARVKLTPNVSVGSTFEWALTNRNADIMDTRVTVDVILAW